MKFITTLLIAGITLSAPLAHAATVVCPQVGQFTLNGDSLYIEYAPTLGLGDTDVGYLLSMNAEHAVFVANRLGAKMDFPTALLEGKIKSGKVIFTAQEARDQAVTCTAE